MKLTPDQIEALFESAALYRSKGLRAGQSLMNALHEVNRDVYMSVPEDIDPFYVDSRVDKLIEFINEP